MSESDSAVAPVRAFSHDPHRPPPSERAEESTALKGADHRRTRKGLFALLPLALLAAGYFYAIGGQEISTDNAYVQADKVAISTDVSGLVEKVEVTENETVSKGQVLFRLRPEPFKIALASASANLGMVRNQILTLQANYNQALAEIDRAQSDLSFFEQAYQRQKELVSVNAVSRTAYDQARHDLDTTLKKIAVAKFQASSVLAQLGGRADTPISDQPAWLQAMAQVDEAHRNLENSVVRAPFAGNVTNVDSLQVGAYLQPPQSGISLVASNALWVAAQPKETELTNLRPGQTVVIHVDAYPGVVWRGSVESISPASGASFSLLPAQNTTGNWVKVVQRIPVRIRIDDQAGKPQLRHGMSVQADINVGQSRGLPGGFFAHRDRPDE